MIHSTCNRVENILGQGETMGTSFFSFSHNVDKSSPFQDSKNTELCGNMLTVSQPKNFRLFQTERVCRQQF